MNQGPRFCTSCGSELVDDARFCVACGTATAQPVVPEPTNPVGQHSVPAGPGETPSPPPLPSEPPASVVAPPSERVISVIPNATVKRGFLGIGSKPYTIVVTDRRMIFAHMTSQMMKQMVADARDEAKAEGKGFMQQWGAQMKAYSGFAAGYLQKSPDEIIAETPQNFTIENATIVKAKLKVGGAGDEHSAASPDRLIIKTTDKKYDISLGAGIKQAREALVAAALI